MGFAHGNRFPAFGPGRPEKSGRTVVSRLRTRQAEGEGGEAAVMAEADLRGERPIPEEHAGGAGPLGVFPDFKIIDREAQTAGDLEEELHPDKRRRITRVFAIAHMFHPVNASCILRDTHAIHTLDDPCQTGLRSCR